MIIKTYDRLRMGLKTNIARSASNATKQYKNIERIEPYQNESKQLFSNYRAIFNSLLGKRLVWRFD